MAAIFESTTLGPTERLIMLALADHADDDGRCYPSIQRLCQRTGLSERAVRTNLRALEKSRYIRTEKGGGRGGTSLYFISVNQAADAPFSAQKGAADAPGRKCPPAADAGEKGHLVPVKGAADAPEPSGTTIRTITAAADARAREAENSEHLIWSILHALGFDRGQTIPKYWMGADAPLIVSRWVHEFGLTHDEVCHVARQNAIQHGSPANGPKVLARHMRDFAEAKAGSGFQGASQRASPQPPRIRARLPSEIPPETIQ